MHRTKIIAFKYHLQGKGYKINDLISSYVSNIVQYIKKVNLTLAIKLIAISNRINYIQTQNFLKCNVYSHVLCDCSCPHHIKNAESLSNCIHSSVHKNKKWNSWSRLKYKIWFNITIYHSFSIFYGLWTENHMFFKSSI